MMLKRLFVLFFAFWFLTACNETGFKSEKVFLGKQTVPVATLNLGRQVYIEYCMGCHGMSGEGNGPAAIGSVPPPRNFTQGLYKFGLVKDGGLPTDEDFKRIIQHGLNGTGMLKWDISDDQTYAVTQYIKTFAPQVWENKDQQAGVKIDFISDPFGLARKSFAIEHGKEVYHLVANCQSCHRAYLTQDELNSLSMKLNKTAAPEFDPSMYELKIQESEYYLYQYKDRKVKFMPPDFTWNEVRSASDEKGIAERLCAGVTGSGMPAWCGVVSNEDVWALAYYVKSLFDLKNNFKKREELMSKLVAPIQARTK
jgi:mono/diheme cytochrome c family protein